MLLAVMPVPSALAHAPARCLQRVEGMPAFMLPTFSFGGQLFRALEVSGGINLGKQVRPARQLFMACSTPSNSLLLRASAKPC